MTIKQIWVDDVGASGIYPRNIKLYCTNTYAEVITAGFLTPSDQQAYGFLENDIVEVSYGNPSNNLATLTPSINATTKVITLVPWIGGAVSLPTVSNNFANFSGTEGVLADAGYSPSDAAKTKVVMANAATVTGQIVVAADTAGTIKDTTGITAIAGGNLQAGTTTGTAGTVASCPGTTTTGRLILAAVASAGAFNSTISNRSLGQSTVFSIGDPGATTASILTSLVNADVGANLISFSVTCGFAALATGGSVTLYASSGSKQYRIFSLRTNAGGTNFSGGGGDRLAQISDGTTAFSIIPATNLQTLVNALWGVSTPLPFPAGGVSSSTLTAAGASLVLKYSGGTTDYTAGSIVITGLLERVA